MCSETYLSKEHLLNAWECNNRAKLLATRLCEDLFCRAYSLILSSSSLSFWCTDHIWFWWGSKVESRRELFWWGLNGSYEEQVFLAPSSQYFLWGGVFSPSSQYKWRINYCLLPPEAKRDFTIWLTRSNSHEESVSKNTAKQPLRGHNHVLRTCLVPGIEPHTSPRYYGSYYTLALRCPNFKTISNDSLIRPTSTMKR
jgi:hypothetical protein